MTEHNAVINLSATEAQKFRGKMLGWYDLNGRDTIPWRAPKGQMGNPYHVWLSEIMCQQTTVQAVIPYFLKFTEKWPTIAAMAAATREDIMREWAGLGYYARARNLHECAKIVAFELSGDFPDTKEGLLKLPGIGDYTSAAIACMAFGRTETVVDGNIERIMARYFAIDTPVPKGKKALKEAAALFFQGDIPRCGDFAQSLMDLGAMICTPKSPKCVLCPIMENCAARMDGAPERYPVRQPKQLKPQKTGVVFWAETQDGAVILERRADTSMMGGMLGLPTTYWIEKAKGSNPLDVDVPDDNDDNIVTLSASARALIGHIVAPPEQNEHAAEEPDICSAKIIGQVKHSFTHFDLTLDVVKIQLSLKKLGNLDSPSSSGYFLQDRQAIAPDHFPTLFKKAVLLCQR